MREGYNSRWQWKQWYAEVEACRRAIVAGQIAEAKLHLELAEELDNQLLLFDLVDADQPDPQEDEYQGPG